VTRVLTASASLTAFFSSRTTTFSSLTTVFSSVVTVGVPLATVLVSLITRGAWFMKAFPGQLIARASSRIAPAPITKVFPEGRVSVGLDEERDDAAPHSVHVRDQKWGDCDVDDDEPRAPHADAVKRFHEPAHRVLRRQRRGGGEHHHRRIREETLS